MSIQRIDIPERRTHGWQARAYLATGRRLTRFFADGACGGYFASRVCAERAEAGLKRLAKRQRKDRA